MISSDSACHFLEKDMRKTITVNSRNLDVCLLLHRFVICVMRNFGECIWFGVVAGGQWVHCRVTTHHTL